MKNDLRSFLPSSKDALDFAKVGLGLYLIGLFVMFMYLVQLNVLSTDLIKPHAIIIGIYVWILFDSFPKLVLYLFKRIIHKPFVHNLLFLLILLVVYGTVISLLCGFSYYCLLFAKLMTLSVLLCFSPDNPIRSSMKIPTSSLRLYLFITIFAFLFSISIFPNIPQYLGGGHPQTVKVFATDKEVFLSQYSQRDFDADGMIEADLLYESSDAYYFIQKVSSSGSGTVFDFKVKKVKKDLVKKIEFTKPIWISFKE